MKANRFSVMKKDDAQVGIGTLIIFIAMVLVAAVAAAVLINTSGVLQQKAQATGKEATEEVSSNIQIEQVSGDRADNTSAVSAAELNSSLQLVEIKIKPSAGSASIDIRQMIVSISDGKTRADLSYNASAMDAVNLNWTGSNTTFIAEEVRDEDDSFDKTTNPVINSGDLIKLYMNTGGDGGLNLDLDSRSNLKVTLRPESGTPVGVDIVTPNSYGVNRYVELYP